MSDRITINVPPSIKGKRFSAKTRKRRKKVREIIQAINDKLLEGTSTEQQDTTFHRMVYGTGKRGSKT